MNDCFQHKYVTDSLYPIITDVQETSILVEWYKPNLALTDGTPINNCNMMLYIHMIFQFLIILSITRKPFNSIDLAYNHKYIEISCLIHLPRKSKQTYNYFLQLKVWMFRKLTNKLVMNRLFCSQKVSGIFKYYYIQ